VADPADDLHSIAPGPGGGERPDLRLQRTAPEQQELEVEREAGQRVQEDPQTLLFNEPSREADREAVQAERSAEAGRVMTPKLERVDAQLRQHGERAREPVLAQGARGVSIAGHRALGSTQVESLERPQGPTSAVREIPPGEEDGLGSGREDAAADQALRVDERARPLLDTQDIRGVPPHPEVPREVPVELLGSSPDGPHRPHGERRRRRDVRAELPGKRLGPPMRDDQRQLDSRLGDD